MPPVSRSRSITDDGVWVVVDSTISAVAVWGSGPTAIEAIDTPASPSATPTWPIMPGRSSVRTTSIDAAGGIVSAVCHGPAALVNARRADGSLLVAGKRVAAFTNDEEEEVQSTDVVPFLLASTLEERGAFHQNAANWANNVVVDGRLITGQNPQSASSLGEALRDALLA